MELAGRVFEVSARMRIAQALALDLRKLGRFGRSPGRSATAALRAAWTSRAALSILREMSNWIEIELVPSELVEVSSTTPGISPRRRSSGAATVAAMVEGSAPGRFAVTWMVGYSMLGNAATGRKL